MKATGILLLIVGLLMTLYSGFTYVSREKVVDIGDLEITADKEHEVNWKPYMGIGAMVLGGALLLISRKKFLTA